MLFRGLAANPVEAVPLQADDAPNEAETGRRITVLLADDHPLFRQALRSALAAEPDIEVVGEATNGDEAVQSVVSMRPDVVLIDIAMPVCNGIEATRSIKSRSPKTIVLALTVHDDLEHVSAMLQAGAAGYLTKDVLGDEVVQAVRAVATGEAVLSSTALKLLVQHLPDGSARPAYVPDSGEESLTCRELEVLRLVARGLSNAEIGDHLGLSKRTVSSHLEQVFEKLSVASRTEAVAQALRAGLLTVNDFN